MLYNKQGQQVNVPTKFNSRENPNMFRDLREVKEPSKDGHGKMFNIGTRARMRDDVQ